MLATIATSAHLLGLTIEQALWDYPLSAILQMMHAKGVSNGGDFDWIEAGEPDEELMGIYDELLSLPIEDILNNIQ